jgi:GNAT superfamily N-acetyltransferase
MRYSTDRNLPIDQVVALYKANNWSSANKPELLMNALQHSHALVSAWDGGKLVALGNAISDGFLVAYFPHLLVLPEYQGKGIGTEIMNLLKKKYAGFHQLMLTADGKAVEFYKKCGFERAGSTEPMWIYSGKEH